MRVLVCGGRDYGKIVSRDRLKVSVNRAEVIALDHKLRDLWGMYGDDLEILHGDARGADTLAKNWAASRQIPYISVPARWNKLGKGAGYERNARMLKNYSPDLCLVCTGGKGTAMMKSLCIRADIPVIDVGA